MQRLDWASVGYYELTTRTLATSPQCLSSRGHQYSKSGMEAVFMKRILRLGKYWLNVSRTNPPHTSSTLALH